MKLQVNPIAFVIALTTVPINAVAEDVSGRQALEASAHSHQFYSEKFDGTLPSITYLVCNKSGDPSDFFWEGVGFGVGETEPIPGHFCVEKIDMISPQGDKKLEAYEEITRVHVLDRSAKVPAILWCNFGSIDRCEQSLLANFGRWASTLRAFGEGATDDAFPFFSASVQQEGSRYFLRVSRPPKNNRLVIVAVGAPVGAVSFTTTLGTELVQGNLSDMITLSERGIFSNLSSEQPAAMIGPSTDFENGGELYVDNKSGENIRLVMLLVGDSGWIFRIDSLLLPQLF